MNCKQGDIAMIVGSDERGPLPLAGYIVECVRLMPGGWWDVGRKLAPKHSGRCHDRCLRPIRDQDGEDEILHIAGKPQEVTA